MEIEIYKVDAFCEEIFSGNPAAVCPLETWPDDRLMQNIAAENNLSDTAFFVRQNDQFKIRWFTPVAEVDLCGHATLAAAHVLFQHMGFSGYKIVFHSRSGDLEVRKDSDLLTLNFPADLCVPIDVTEDMHRCFSATPIEACKGKNDYLLVFPSEEDIANMKVNLSLIEKLKEVRGVIVTAKGDSVDFVSRFFAPRLGIPEDPVTGSAHTLLTPYWFSKLGKQELTAVQLSARKGFLQCKNLGDRIEISGKAKTFLVGRLFLNQHLHGE